MTQQIEAVKSELMQALADNGIRFSPRQIVGVILDVFGFPCQHGGISVTERNGKIGYTLSWGNGSQTVYSLAEALRSVGVGNTESPLAIDRQRYHEWVDLTLARYAGEDNTICNYVHFADETTMRDVNGVELKVGDTVRWRCNGEDSSGEFVVLGGLGIIQSPCKRRYEMGAVVKVTASDSDYWPMSGGLAQPPMDLLKI